MGVKQAIKSLDAFPRAEEHLLMKTQSGAFGIFPCLFRFFFSFFGVEKNVAIHNLIWSCITAIVLFDYMGIDVLSCMT